MRRMLGRRPSAGRAALIVACVALVAALGGGAIADVATKALTKKEKKQTKKIATKKANQAIDERAPGLSVANAATAISAGNVDGQSMLRWRQTISGNATRSLGQLGEFQFRLVCANGGASLQARTSQASAVYREIPDGPASFLNTGYTQVNSAADSSKARSFMAFGDSSIVAGSWWLIGTGPGNSCRVLGVVAGS